MSILDGYTISYAQNREDLLASAFFPDIEKGFYVDVGANHPIRHSVTKILYSKGWRGINVEPNPAMFELIECDRKEDINLNIGISNKGGELNLRLYHSSDGLAGLSTFSPFTKESYTSNTSEETKNYSDIKVKVKTLYDIFIENNIKEIHFMKVDVEGFEYEVLEGNDWNKFRPQLICIEANHLVKDWHKYLESKKYKVVFNDGLNDYLLSEESMFRLEFFDYAKTILLDKQVINSDLAEILQEKEQKLEYFESEYQKTVSDLSRLESEYSVVVNQRNELVQISSSPTKMLRIMLVKVNRRIKYYIDKLQKPRHKHRAPLLKIKSVSRVKSPDLISAAHDYDLQNLKQPNPYLSPRRYLFVILSTGYFLLRKLLKITYRSLRRIKGAES